MDHAKVERLITAHVGLGFEVSVVSCYKDVHVYICTYVGGFDRVCRGTQPTKRAGISGHKVFWV